MHSCQLRNKSDIFDGAAKLLHNNDLYPVVAHAAYYSCLQLMKCIWLHSMNKSQEELVAGISQSSSGTHDYLLNAVVGYISTLQHKNSRGDARDLRNGIPQLKRLRVRADYEDVCIGNNESQQAIQWSTGLLKILKTY